MLLWLRNIVPKRFVLLSKLCLLVSGIHVFLLCFLFVGYKNQQAYALEIAKQLQINADSKIMFMPLYQTTHSLNKKNAGGRRSSGNTLKLASAQKKTKMKERAATSLVSEVSTAKSKKKGIGRNKAKTNKHKKSKALENKKEQEKIKQEEKAQKEQEQQKEKQEIKKEPEAIEEKKELIPEMADQSAEKTDLKGDETSGKANGSGQEDIVYVGQQEYDALGMQTYLQQELSTNWQPPQGMPAESSCEISFSVDWQGRAATVKVSKSSGALVYDISARSALLAMEFPDWARGKAFKITFKQ